MAATTLWWRFVPGKLFVSRIAAFVQLVEQISGVEEITLGHDNDEVVGMVCVENENEDILVVSEKGYGKRSKIEDYRLTNRGGKGVKTINITDKPIS